MFHGIVSYTIYQVLRVGVRAAATGVGVAPKADGAAPKSPPAAGAGVGVVEAPNKLPPVDGVPKSPPEAGAGAAPNKLPPGAAVGVVLPNRPPPLAGAGPFAAGRVAGRVLTISVLIC